MAWYHQLTAKILNKFPWLYQKLTVLTAGEIPADIPENPWTELTTDSHDASVMLITSGGVHTPQQDPFDMDDSRGDTSYRFIPREQTEFEITHDYYDHSDADEDLNCLFPLPLARHLANFDVIGSLVDRHLSFMGHIENPLVPELVHQSLPAMWEELDDKPELALLSPG
jgi:D-proline reductase (dithiol) PrdB